MKILIAFLSILMCTTLSAHHALDFISLESYTTPQSGEMLFYLHYDHMTENDGNPLEDHWEITPGLSRGLTDDLMIDGHFHYAKFGTEHLTDQQKPNYSTDTTAAFVEALAVSLQYQLVDLAIFKVGLGFTYEQPMNRAKVLLGSEEGYEGTLILHRDLSRHSTIVANISLASEDGEEEFSWGVGGKKPISSDEHGIAGGLEISGSDSGDFSVMPAIHMPFGEEGTILKTGMEFGNRDNYRYNLSLMSSF